jgi:hypothetical protein
LGEIVGMSDADTLRLLRRYILGIIAAALIATEAELFFVGHTSSNNGQIIAVILIGVGLAAVTAHAVFRSTGTVVAFRFAMYLLLVFGLDGLMTHYHSAVGAALKSQPSLAGFQLLREALTGKIPLLAPGMLIQIGLLGLVYTFQHPLDARVGRRIESIRLRD